MNTSLSAPPSVTIIIRTKNSAHTIDQALTSIAAQRFEDFELLVIDSGSTDETLEIVDQFDHRLITIAAEDYFPGPVLNRGAAQARGHLLVFWNSDVVALGPQCLGELLAPFADPEVVASFARQLPRPDAHPWVRRDYAASFPDQPQAPPWIPLSLPLAAMRRATWTQRPFYDDAWASEDSEWGHWARSQGYKIQYCPTAEVMHSHNYTLHQLYGRRYVEGEADAFIKSQKARRRTYLKRYLSSVGRDIFYSLRDAEILSALWSPLGRAVYHGAHFLGYRHGYRRRQQGIKDRRQGQRVALDHHPSAR